MKSAMSLRALAAAVVLASAAVAAASQGQQQAMSNQQFLDEAARGSLAEVTLGQMAETKAQNPQVKQFASRMIADHSKALAEARQLAERSGAEVTEQMTQKHEKMAESLSNESPEGFDRAYMQAMVEDHRSTVRKFEAQAESGDGPVAAYAEKQLPVLREHLAMAESIANEL